MMKNNEQDIEKIVTDILSNYKYVFVSSPVFQYFILRGSGFQYRRPFADKTNVCVKTKSVESISLDRFLTDIKKKGLKNIYILKDVENNIVWKKSYGINHYQSNYFIRAFLDIGNHRFMFNKDLINKDSLIKI